MLAREEFLRERDSEAIRVELQRLRGENQWLSGSSKPGTRSGRQGVQFRDDLGNPERGNSGRGTGTGGKPTAGRSSR